MKKFLFEKTLNRFDIISMMVTWYVVLWIATYSTPFAILFAVVVILVLVPISVSLERQVERDKTKTLLQEKDQIISSYEELSGELLTKLNEVNCLRQKDKNREEWLARKVLGEEYQNAMDQEDTLDLVYRKFKELTK